MVIKSKMAIVLACANRANHVDARIARVPSNMARTLYEQTPQPVMLRRLALVAQACGQAIHVTLGIIGLVRRRRQLVRMRGNKKLNGGSDRRKKPAILPCGVTHCKKRSFVTRRLVRHFFIKRKLIQVGTRGTDLAIANLAHLRTVTPSSQAILDELTQVGLLVAHHNVVGTKVADHATDTAERRRHHDVVG